MFFRKHLTGNISGRLLVFASAYFILCLLPILTEFKLTGDVMVADMLDLLTPVVTVILIFRIVMAARGHRSVGLMCTAVMIAGAVLFVEGHGIHLSANAISRILGEGSSAAQRLSYFYDEVLGHILWDGGMIVMMSGLAVVAFQGRGGGKTRTEIVLPASALFAFSCFTNAVEGQTVVFTLPIAVLFPVVVYYFAQVRGISIQENPILLFLVSGYSLMLMLFLFWGIINGGFPEFSEIGWI